MIPVYLYIYKMNFAVLREWTHTHNLKTTIMLNDSLWTLPLVILLLLACRDWLLLLSLASHVTFISMVTYHIMNEWKLSLVMNKWYSYLLIIIAQRNIPGFIGAWEYFFPFWQLWNKFQQIWNFLPFSTAGFLFHFLRCTEPCWSIKNRILRHQNEHLQNKLTKYIHENEKIMCNLWITFRTDGHTQTSIVSCEYKLLNTAHDFIMILTSHQPPPAGA